MMPRLSGQNGEGKQHLVARLEQDLADDAQAGRRARHDLHEVRIERFAVASFARSR